MKQMLAALFTVALFLSIHLVSSLAYNDGIHMEVKFRLPRHWSEEERRAFEAYNELIQEAVEMDRIRKIINSEEWFKDGQWQVEADFDHAANWRRQMEELGWTSSIQSQ